MSANVNTMSSTEAYKAFADAKKTISEQTVIRNAVKAHYASTVEQAGGRLVVFVDDAGVAHGFEIGDKGKASISVGNLEKALAKRGISADEINKIKEESLGNSAGTFGTF